MAPWFYIMFWKTSISLVVNDLKIQAWVLFLSSYGTDFFGALGFK